MIKLFYKEFFFLFQNKNVNTVRGWCHLLFEARCRGQIREGRGGLWGHQLRSQFHQNFSCFGKIYFYTFFFGTSRNSKNDIRN